MIDDITDDFGIEFKDSDDIDTIGGWMQSVNADIEVDDYINTEKDKWIVLDTDNHTIKQVALLKGYNVGSDEDSSDGKDN